MRTLLVGVDSGTQSTKALVVDARDGKVLASASQGYDLLPNLPPGAKEQHPTHGAMLPQVLLPGPPPGQGRRRRSQSHRRQWPATRLRSPRCQRRSHSPGETLVRHFHRRRMRRDHRPTRWTQRRDQGRRQRHPPRLHRAKILWLKNNEPKNYQRLAQVLLPHDYLNFWLTGEKVMEYGDASGTALLDVKKRKWSNAVIDAIDPELASKLLLLIQVINLPASSRPPPRASLIWAPTSSSAPAAATT